MRFSALILASFFLAKAAYAAPNALEALSIANGERKAKVLADNMDTNGPTVKVIKILQDTIDKSFADGSLKTLVGDTAPAIHETVGKDLLQAVSVRTQQIALLNAEVATLKADKRDYKTFLDLCSEPNRAELVLVQKYFQSRIAYINSKDYKNELGDTKSSAFLEYRVLLQDSLNITRDSQLVCNDMISQARMQVISEGSAALGQPLSIQDQQCQEFVNKGYSPSMAACRKNTDAEGDPIEPSGREPLRGGNRPWSAILTQPTIAKGAPVQQVPPTNPRSANPAVRAVPLGFDSVISRP